MAEEIENCTTYLRIYNCFLYSADKEANIYVIITETTYL
jgi:hypothetical protein